MRRGNDNDNSAKQSKDRSKKKKSKKSPKSKKLDSTVIQEPNSHERTKSPTRGKFPATSLEREKSNHKPRTKKEKKAQKKQIRIKGANPYKTPLSPVKINEFPTIILSKGLMKELHTLQECMVTKSGTARLKVSTYGTDQLLEGDQMRLIMFGIFRLRWKIIMYCQLTSKQLNTAYSSKQ